MASSAHSRVTAAMTSGELGRELGDELRAPAAEPALAAERAGLAVPEILDLTDGILAEPGRRRTCLRGSGAQVRARRQSRRRVLLALPDRRVRTEPAPLAGLIDVLALLVLAAPLLRHRAVRRWCSRRHCFAAAL